MSDYEWFKLMGVLFTVGAWLQFRDSLVFYTMLCIGLFFAVSSAFIK